MLGEGGKQRHGECPIFFMSTQTHRHIHTSPCCCCCCCCYLFFWKKTEKAKKYEKMKKEKKRDCLGYDSLR